MFTATSKTFQVSLKTEVLFDLEDGLIERTPRLTGGVATSLGEMPMPLCDITQGELL